jgi:hypothetical protein
MAHSGKGGRVGSASIIGGKWHRTEREGGSAVRLLLVANGTEREEQEQDVRYCDF